MRPPEDFETDRLVLRRASVDDAEALYDAYAGDPRATRYLSWETHRTVQETREFLAGADAAWMDGHEFIWTIVRRASDDPVGAVSAADTPHGVEIGYVLSPAHWGQGLMGEAIGVLLDWLRGQSGVHRIWAYCAVDHVRSTRLLEASGMTYEGTLRRWVLLPNLSAEPSDAKVYSWIPADERDASPDASQEQR